MQEKPETWPDRVLVSDFDGTMTDRDFYRMALDELIPQDCPDYWSQYRAGRLTHFDALKNYFAEIRAEEAVVLEMVRRMQLDPELPTAVAALRQAGWEVVVTSAGCLWYIQYLLDRAGVSLTVFGNPGRYEAGRGLVMERPTESRFSCWEVGVDKEAVVRFCRDSGRTVAFAGDGFPDAPAALVADPQLRFARSDLVQQLEEEGQPYRSFDRWRDVAAALLEMSR